MISVRHSFGVGFCALFLSFLWGTCALFAAEMLDENNVQISFGIRTNSENPAQTVTSGLWKPGRWIPVRIGFKKSDPQQENERFSGKIVLETFDPDGTPVLQEREIDGTLPESVEMCARLGRTTASYQLKILRRQNDGLSLIFQTSGTLTGAMEEPKGLILVVGKTLAGVDAGISQMTCAGEFRPRTIHLNRPQDLPKNLAAWELIDTVVVTSDDADVFQAWTSDEIARLAEWVRRGGSLVLSIGKNAETFVQNSDWSPFWPGTLEKAIPIRETSAMELFAQSPIPVTLLGVTEKHRIFVSKFTNLAPEIQVRASQFDLPLVLRRRMGLGQVNWVTFDLDHPALTSWGGRGNFLSALLEFSLYNPDSEEAVHRGLHSGYNDMAGQLRSALDDFVGIRSISFGVLVLFFLLYLALIGPGCWFLCKKLPKGGEAASWVVFCLTVAGGCAILSHIANSGTDGIRFNRVRVVDFVQETNFVREQAWGNVWSPDASRLTLALAPFSIADWDAASAASATGETNATSKINVTKQKNEKIPPNKTLNFSQSAYITWFGLPGSYLGGMDSRVSSVADGISRKETACRMEETRFENIPFFARSTRSFCAQRCVQLSPETFPQFGKLHNNQYSRVLGEIRNPFSVPLVHCLLFYGEWAYEIGRLEPGQTFRIDETTSYLGAASLLVDADYVEDRSIKSSVGLRRVNRPYDRTSRDPEYILRNMLFFSKTGGRSYTGQQNRYQYFLDGSALLTCETAIFYGVAEPAEKTDVFQIQDAVTHSPLALKNPDDKNVQIVRGFIPVEVMKKDGKNDEKDPESMKENR